MFSHIISCMRRSYWQDGEMKTGKLGNVYLHCKVECVKLVQPAFISFLVGVSNGHKIFQLLAKFCLCSICSQNLDECSLARARKIFAIARMLGFSLKFA